MSWYTVQVDEDALRLPWEPVSVPIKTPFFTTDDMRKLCLDAKQRNIDALRRRATYYATCLVAAHLSYEHDATKDQRAEYYEHLTVCMNLFHETYHYFTVPDHIDEIQTAVYMGRSMAKGWTSCFDDVVILEQGGELVFPIRPKEHIGKYTPSAHASCVKGDINTSQLEWVEETSLGIRRSELLEVLGAPSVQRKKTLHLPFNADMADQILDHFYAYLNERKINIDTFMSDELLITRTMKVFVLKHRSDFLWNDLFLSYMLLDPDRTEARSYRLLKNMLQEFPYNYTDLSFEVGDMPEPLPTELVDTTGEPEPGVVRALATPPQVVRAVRALYAVTMPESNHDPGQAYTDALRQLESEINIASWDTDVSVIDLKKSIRIMFSKKSPDLDTIYHIRCAAYAVEYGFVDRVFTHLWVSQRRSNWLIEVALKVPMLWDLVVHMITWGSVNNIYESNNAVCLVTAAARYLSVTNIIEVNKQERQFSRKNRIAKLRVILQEIMGKQFLPVTSIQTPLTPVPFYPLVEEAEFNAGVELQEAIIRFNESPSN